MTTVHQRSGTASLLGPREVNEDSFDLQDLSLDGGTVRALLAVADGMGGLRGGDIASRTAIGAVRQAVAAGGTAEALAAAVHRADEEIRAIAAVDGDDRAMGTTLTAALVDGHEAVVVHVGDTRAYVVHAGQISQITEDHSRVGRLLAQGLLTEDEAMHHPEQNVLERALGAGDPVGDVYRVGIGPGDRLFLCTDGLHTFVTAAEIGHELEHNPSLQSACDRLARLAEERGSQDNITGVAWEYPGEPGPHLTTGGRTTTVVRPRATTLPPRRRPAPLARPPQSVGGLAGMVLACYVLGFLLGLAAASVL